MSYFISFAVEGRNLGCVVTDAFSASAALEKVTELGLNQGGEAAIWQCDSKEADRLGRDKVLTREYLRSLGYKSKSEVSEEQKKKFMSHAVRVCRKCNDALADK